MKSTDSVFKIRKADEKLEDLLKNNRLFLSSPKSFNDPFDASILPQMEISDDEFRQWYESQLKKNKILTDVQRKNAERMLQTGEFKSNEAKAGILKGWRDGLEKFGICSFASNIWNILLWSHYGDNHQGVAVGIEVKKLQSADHSLSEVHYSSQYPSIELHDEVNYQEILKRKYLCWEYEKEFRIIKGGAAKTFFNLPKWAVKQVIFGMNFPGDGIQKVLSWINKEQMTPDILVALHRNGKYELRFEERNEWFYTKDEIKNLNASSGF